MGTHLDPRIKEACALLDAAQRLDSPYPGDYHLDRSLEQRMAMATDLRSRAAALRRAVHGR